MLTNRKSNHRRARLSLALCLSLAGACDGREETLDAAVPVDAPMPAQDAPDLSCTRAAYTLTEVTSTAIMNDTVVYRGDLNLSGIGLTDTFTMPWAFPFFGVDHTDFVVDTNANLWMAASANTESEYDLAAGGAQGLPVIAVWNETLTSDDYGDGLVINVMTSPDRVMFHWETEETDDGGSFTINDVGVTLFPNGYILLRYDSFETTICDDAGSGISRANGTDFVDVTAEFGAVCDMVDRRFLLEPPCAPNDFDDDGLENGLEETLGTSPDNADTDGDGLKDGWEHFITGTDPLAP